MNRWITFFMEMVNLLSLCFTDVRYREGSKAEADSLRKITEALSGSGQGRDGCGYLLIRSRGLAENPLSVGSDGYELITRNISVDTAVTPTMIRDAGSRMSFFADRLSQAFEIFSANNIISMYIKIPRRFPEDLERLRESLRILSGYVRAAESDSPIVFKRDGRPISLPLVKDEKGRPHPNLTLATGLNNLDPVKTQEMVKKIDSMLLEPGSKNERGQFIDVYDAMKCSPKFHQFMKPPIEINNTSWLLASSDEETLANEKIGVARGAVDYSENFPHKTAHLLTCIYGSDFDQINAWVLGERLILITRFLDDMNKEKTEDAVSREIFENILKRFTQVRREVRNDLKLMENKLHVLSGGVEIPMGMIHPEFAKMIRFFSTGPKVKEEIKDDKDKISGEKAPPVKPDTLSQQDAKPVETGSAQQGVVEAKPSGERADHKPSETEKITTEETVQEANDIEKLVGDRIDQMERNTTAQSEPPELPAGKQNEPEAAEPAVEDMVTPFKRCFDSKGHFVKGSFEENIPAFARHKDRIFEFIWQYLKATMNRDDRLALLNSLYLLVSKINQSEKAVSVLLRDIFNEPGKVNISDRNGLMLANLVIRKYNKELNKEIELTPEEVFLVKEGLIGSAVKAASGIIESDAEKVMKKRRTVYTGITKSLDFDSSDDPSLPFRYLLNLERETCIFLSLVGGPTPRAVIKNAIETYGNPESEIYKINGDAGHLTAFLQHLKILVRGLGRIGSEEDIPVLEDLINKEKIFMQFGHDQRSQDTVRRIMQWAGNSAKNIASARETVTA